MKIYCCFAFFLCFFQVFCQTPVLVPFRALSGKYGYKNHKNKVVVQPVFEKANAFEKNVALVCQEGKWGLLNAKGIALIPPGYDTLAYFEGLLIAGNYIKPPELPHLHFSPGWLLGLVTDDNRVVQPLHFKKIERNDIHQILLTPFHHWEVRKANGDTLAVVEADTLITLPVPEAFDLDTIPLDPDWRMPCKLGRTWGFVDSLGLMRISNRYEQVCPFQENLAAIKLNGYWGFIDKNEKIIIQPTYEQVSNVKNGLVIAVRKKKVGVISRVGKDLSGLNYDSVSTDKSGLFITRKGNKQGILGKNGYELLPPRFDQVFPQADGNIIVQRGRLFGLMSENGSVLFPVLYDAIFFEPLEKNYVLFHKAVPFTITL